MIYCPTITTVLNNNSISHPKMGLYDPLQDQESWQLVALRGASLLGLPMSGARPHPSVRGSPRSASCQRGGQRRAIPAPPQFQAELPRPVLRVTAEPVPPGLSLCTVLLPPISPWVWVPWLSLTELLHKKLHGFRFPGHQPEAHPEPTHRKNVWRHRPKLLT